MRCSTCESVFDEKYLIDGQCPCCKEAEVRVYMEVIKEHSETRVKCLECDSEFYELLIHEVDTIDESDDEEYYQEICPVCGSYDSLVDIEKEGE